eukprot:474223-Rhodomonas_salina.2
MYHTPRRTISDLSTTHVIAPESPGAPQPSLAPHSTSRTPSAIRVQRRVCVCLWQGEQTRAEGTDKPLRSNGTCNGKQRRVRRGKEWRGGGRERRERREGKEGKKGKGKEVKRPRRESGRGRERERERAGEGEKERAGGREKQTGGARCTYTLRPHPRL